MLKEVNRAQVLEAIDDFNSSDKEKTFAEFLAKVFKGKLIEIYLGDAYENISVDQISTSYPAVFCGEVVGAYKECLVINAAYVDTDNKPKMGNLLFINERGIRLLTEIDPNNLGTLADMFLKSKDASTIKKIYNQYNAK